MIAPKHISPYKLRVHWLFIAFGRRVLGTYAVDYNLHNHCRLLDALTKMNKNRRVFVRFSISPALRRADYDSKICGPKRSAQTFEGN